MCTCPNRSACAERERMSARSFNKRSTLFRAVCMRPLACPRAWLCLLCRLCRPVKELCCDCKTGHQASAKAIGPRSPETFWPTSSALISIGRSLKRLLDPSSGAFMPIRSVRHRSRFLQTTYARHAPILARCLSGSKEHSAKQRESVLFIGTQFSILYTYVRWFWNSVRTFGCERL